MHGRFWTYRATAPGERTGNGYLPGVTTLADMFGNISLFGRPRKGESVPGWVRRKVAALLDSHGVVCNSDADYRAGGPAYILPWWRRDGYIIRVVPVTGERGCYRVSVYPGVDLVKR